MYSNRRLINRRPPPPHTVTVDDYNIIESPRSASWSVKLTNSTVITHGIHTTSTVGLSVYYNTHYNITSIGFWRLKNKPNTSRSRVLIISANRLRHIRRKLSKNSTAILTSGYHGTGVVDDLYTRVRWPSADISCGRVHAAAEGRYFELFF